MSCYTVTAPRRGLAVMALGLALLLTACGPTGGSTTPTPTPQPTATPIPACTTWRIIPSPTPERYAHLSAVTALSPTDAWAVGVNFGGDGGGPTSSLIERWDGVAWRIGASPAGVALNGVAGAAPNDVWAVGGWPARVPGSPAFGRLDATLDHWNGAQWSAISSPHPSATVNTLNAVVALAANDVWAVGSYENTAETRVPLIERWDGTDWRVVAPPTPPGMALSGLSSVARIPGTNQLWAVGYMRTGPSPAYEQALIERWDGAAWKIVVGPTLPAGAYGSALTGVVALSDADAWAVGNYTASDHTLRTLITHWDGSAWTVASSPDIKGSLASVAAVRAADARAVGYRFNSDFSNQIPIIEQWDGAAWKVIESPTPQGVWSTSLNAVSADGAGGYWAVGAYTVSPTDRSQTLIARCS